MDLLTAALAASLVISLGIIAFLGLRLRRVAAKRDAVARRAARADEKVDALTAKLRAAEEARTSAESAAIEKEQLAAIGELSAMIAHEIRNPLTIIGNAVSSLRRKETAPEDRSTLLAILEEEAARLNRFMSDLLSYARPVSL